MNMDVINLDIPRLSKNAGADLKRLASFLVRLTEQLRVALSSLDEGNFSPAVGQTIKSAGALSNEVGGLREAIIRTAATVQRTKESIEATMKDTYVAKSELGEYTEEAIASYEVDGHGIDQYFELISNVAGEVGRLSGYIKCGVLTGDEVGVEIGDLSSSSSPAFAVRLTGERLSFLSGGTEVAYMSGTTLYITKAHISGKMILGDYEIDPTDGLIFRYAGN